MRYFRIVALTICFMFIVCTYGHTETIVGGNITEDTVWDLEGSPYIVESTVQVLKNVTLEIKPGVEVRFNENTGLNVGGEINAIGTSNSKIVFTSNNATKIPGSWNSIKFVDSSIDAYYDKNNIYKSGSILKYCIVEYAGQPAVYGGGVSCIESSPLITNCIISNNRATSASHGGGVYVKYAKNLIIKDSIISDNYAFLGGGVDVLYSTVTIKNCIIENNKAHQYGGAIYILNSSNDFVNIIYNEIKNNSSDYKCGGIYIKKNLEPTNLIRHNNIYDNIDKNVLMSEYSKNIDMQNNWWGTIDKSTIEGKIYDYYDDLELGKVLYEPIATQPYDFSGGSITGTLKNYTTFEPITDGSVTCSGGQATTNSTGQYKIENLTPGNYTLTASAPLYHSKTVENVEVQAGQETTQDFELEKKTTGALVGKVLNVKDLSPVENVQVDLENSQNQYQDFTTTQGSLALMTSRLGITHWIFTTLTIGAFLKISQYT